VQPWPGWFASAVLAVAVLGFGVAFAVSAMNDQSQNEKPQASVLQKYVHLLVSGCRTPW
jgi:hypothetical protein